MLRLLSWLAPDPIPESLLEAAGGPFAERVGNDAASGESAAPIPDARDALAELADYSLVKRSDEEPTFAVHRLVQDVTRRTLPESEKLGCLEQALRWVNAGFVGDPQDVRTWPVLEPLAAHARAIAAFADEREFATPTTRLLGNVGLLLETKAQFAEAEPLMRRALEIDEKSFGNDHPDVARDLNNLAQLLQETNRLAEAEPLMRRVLAIFKQSLGPEHPNVATTLNNLAQLLQATNRLAEAEPLMRRALAIDEKSYGNDHPNVAIDLYILTGLLQDTNRLAEAAANAARPGDRREELRTRSP